MGGEPKGWLVAPATDERPPEHIVERLLALARAQSAEVYLVGRAEAYARLGLPVIDDVPGVAGPLSGLVALLERGAASRQQVIALACDMPYLRGSMLAKLCSFAPEAPAVAARDGSVWSPLFARYDAPRMASVARACLEAGERSLRSVLDAARAAPLPLTPDEQAALRDWDAPEDIERGREG
jgi:molybdopterin-guanine dinucleotide biosynthesis protein A